MEMGQHKPCGLIEEVRKHDLRERVLCQGKTQAPIPRATCPPCPILVMWILGCGTQLPWALLGLSHVLSPSLDPEKRTSS